jgi:thiol:disulfide interchange protein DsbD
MAAGKPRLSSFLFQTFWLIWHLISVKRLLIFLSAAAFCLVPDRSEAAAHTQARLVLSAGTANPGDTIMAGVHLKMDPGWHTYWKNPGTSGDATKIAWQLPTGVTAGQIQWPVPEKLVPQKEDDSGKPLPGQFDFEFTTYAYHNVAVLLVPLTLAPDLKPGPLQLKAKVEWLECEKLCLQGGAEVAATLVIASETKPSADAPLIESWKSKLPKSADGLSARANWEKSASGDLRPLILEWTVTDKVAEPDLFPDASDRFEVQHATEVLSAGPENVRLRKVVKKLQGDWPEEISGVLIQKSGAERRGYSVTLPVADASSPASANQSFTVAKSLWQMLLYAFIGGMILNIMPCVLPVIALKILGFVGQAKDEPQRVRKLGLVYAVGVLVSFLALAGLVIGAKAAGQKAGWGMQFSNPQFIVALTVLVTLVALNLFGVFEVTLSGRVMGAAGELSSKHGTAGAFFNGVLATVLATPCTAPFLGVALGFAFGQPAPIIVLMCLTVGLGLAAPYVVLSWHPAWLKFLPKPGAWMEKFKIAMGFPMLATAVWLLSLTTTFYGERSWWLGIFLVLVGTAAWVFGTFVQRGNKRRAVAGVVAAGLLVIGYAWALDAKLDWRAPGKGSQDSSALAHAPKGYPWHRWSPEAVAAARPAGHPVVVDFTAKWCLTCNITVKPAFERKQVIEKLKQTDAAALVADYTLYPPEIGEELERHGRAGVPLVLVYPRDSAKPPLVLPEPLSPSPAHYSKVILDALEKAVQ